MLYLSYNAGLRILFSPRRHARRFLPGWLSWAVSALVTFHPGICSVSQPGLPRVLIIGDSISLGYTPFVREYLRGKAEVMHNPGNAQSTWKGLEELEEWLADGTFAVIHFNWGLWDLCYRHPESTVYGNRDKVRGTLTTTLDQYGLNLEQLVIRLKKTGARLIWANSTPVPEGEAGRFRDDPPRYNRVAGIIMRRHGVAINDLYTFLLPHRDRLYVAPGDVHFTEAGYRLLGQKVAEQILAMLDQSVFSRAGASRPSSLPSARSERRP